VSYERQLEVDHQIEVAELLGISESVLRVVSLGFNVKESQANVEKTPYLNLWVPPLGENPGSNRQTKPTHSFPLISFCILFNTLPERAQPI